MKTQGVQKQIRRIEERITAIEKRMATKDELESVAETVEILATPGALDAIREADRQRREGHGRPVHEFVKELEKQRHV